MKEAVKRIKFEDHGQDFTWWDVDEDGIVVGCGPFQAGIWCGCKVRSHPKLKPGDAVLFKSPHFNKLSTLSYLIEKIINHEPSPKD